MRLESARTLDFHHEITYIEYKDKRKIRLRNDLRRTTK